MSNRGEMRGKQAGVILLAIGLGAIVAACAPADQTLPAGTPSPAAGAAAVVQAGAATPTPAVAGARAAAPATPLPADVQSIQQQMRDLHRDLVQLHSQLPQMGPERRQQVATLMADLMDEMSRFMLLMQPVVDQMTPEERQEAEKIVQQMHANLQQMRRMMPWATPMAATPEPRGTPGAGPMGPQATPGAGPTMSPDGTPWPIGPMGPGDMGWMHDQMSETHRQFHTHMQQLSPQELELMAGHMADLTDDMNRLIDLMGPALARVSPEQRQDLKQQLDRMQDIVGEMMRVAGPLPGTPSPSPAAGPGA